MELADIKRLIASQCATAALDRGETPPALGHIAATCRSLFGLPSETEHEPD